MKNNVLSLKDVVTIRHGKDYKEVANAKSTYPVYGSGDGIVAFVDDYLCEADTIILGRKGTIDKPRYMTHRYWNIDTAFSLSAKDGYSSKYVYYYCLTVDWKSLNSGAAKPSLTQNLIYSLRIPVPPLPEQQKIVDYLDGAFAKIDQLKANAEKQLEDAQSLFSAALEEAMRPKEGWEEKNLEGVADKGTSISYGIVQPGDDFPNGIPVIRPVDLFCEEINLNNSIKRTNPVFSSAYKRTILNGKELLMCVRGTTGVISKSTNSLKGCNVTRGIVPIKISNDTTRNYVFYWLIAPIAKTFIVQKTKGAALKQINIADVKQIPIFLPPLPTQQSIVSHLDALSAKVNQLKENYKTILSECDALKQALLREIFE